MALGDGPSAADERDEVLIKGNDDTPIVTGETETPWFYEGGTWTPVLKGASTAGSYSLTDLNRNRYTKVGNKYTLHAFIRISSIDTAGSGDLLIEMPIENDQNSNVNAIVRCIDIDTPNNHSHFFLQQQSINGSKNLFLNSILEDSSAVAIKASDLNEGAYILFTADVISTT